MQEGAAEASEQLSTPVDPTLRRFAYISAITGALASSIVTMGLVVWFLFSDQTFRTTIVDQHTEAVVGFPVCTINAFASVIVLQATNGPIEFKVLGVQFKGAGGPLTLYVLVFLATVGAFHYLWH